MASDARLNRLQVLAVVAPLAYVAALLAAVAAFGLPSWLGIVAGTAVSVPFAVAFAAVVLRAVGVSRDDAAVRERRFRSLLESAPDAIVIVDHSGAIVMANQEVTRVFGYAPGELVGRPVDVLVPDALRAAHSGHRAAYHGSPATRPMAASLSLTARRKDGSVFPAEISLSPLDSEGGILVTSVIRDITERRRANEERERLRSEAETERQRTRIAMDLHDGIIQSIYAAGLNLEAASSDLVDNPAEVPGRIDRAIGQLNDTITDIRNYIMELRPTRFSGEIAESLMGLAHEFRVNSQIETSIDVAPNLPPLSPEGGSALFHIAKESLNNIRKHAAATSVAVSLRLRDGVVSLVIADDGTGFDASIERPEQHNGLRNMASRARAAGGTLNVISTPRAGTRIRVDIPAQPASGEPG
jgi:two-component system sensor histidine kinase DevS